MSRKNCNLSLPKATLRLAPWFLLLNKHPYHGRRQMARITRRRFLKASGAGALAARTGGIAGILASGKAPAYAQATTVHWLKWADFVPAGDQILRQSMLAEAEKAL